MISPNTAGSSHQSSYRDPAGNVLISKGRVFRTIAESAWDNFRLVQASGILDKLSASGRVVATWPVSLADAPVELANILAYGNCLLVEHQRVPFISYPYEWSFTFLKRAALHHLDLHLDLLQSNFTLSDASAYNIQFIGTRPIFIDILSIRPYVEGEYWVGYRQFCEQFLNPLLLTSITGVSYNGWFRGKTEGISVEDMAMLLPLRSKVSWQVLLHVVLHGYMSAKARSASAISGHLSVTSNRVRPMKKSALIWLIGSLRNWIAEFKPIGVAGTVWQDYERNTSYAYSEEEAKRSFIARYIGHRKPTEVLDLGCNKGSYSQLVLSVGATRVLGIDFDAAAIEGAVERADELKLNLLPLIIDGMNPSPNQGWAQREWLGFKERINADGILALAFLHHLVIGRNVPMANAVDWLVGLAPSGVIEFVPKHDPMVQRMLENREDIFPNYHIDVFRQELGLRVAVVNESVISKSGRTLFEYQR